MEPITALLRIVARAADASAALVTRAGDDAPVAAWGCDGVSAGALLRAAQRGTPSGRLAITLALTLADGSPGALVLVAPGPGTEPATIAPLAEEIGALCDPSGVPEMLDSIDLLVESIEQLGDAVAILQTPQSHDDETRFAYVNGEFTRLFGYGTEILGKSASTLWGPLTDREALGWMRSRIATRHSAKVSAVLYARDDTPHWIELVSTPVEHSSTSVNHIISYRDVTSRKTFVDALAAEKQKLQTTLASIADAVATILPDGRVEFINEAAQRLLGMGIDEAYGADVREVVRLVDDDGRPIDFIPDGDGDPVRRGNAHLRTASGTIDVAYVASRIDSEQSGTVVVIRDVTVEHRIAMRLSFEALHDPLTGLPNRRAFLERLEEAVRAAWEHDERHVVAFLDLDKFKIVNDRFGHVVGDRLLREIAPAMGRVVRSADVLARIGGDEFALLLANCGMSDARRIAETIRAAVDSYRIEHDGEVLSVGVSIGLAPITAGTCDAVTALAEADAACYQAKAAGRNAISG